MKREISLTLNGSAVTVTVAPSERLIDVLRGPLSLTGTKQGCREGVCGACTVIVDGRAVNSCLFPAPEAEGRRVTTIEGIAEAPERLSPLQQAFIEHGGTQCGFCTPGMILSAVALLEARPEPTDDEIRAALAGNLCRCTGYVQIVRAIREAGAARRREQGVRQEAR
ncbi:MAG: (2Fe-2S)-binding protein [Planctomycetota bacterium]